MRRFTLPLVAFVVFALHLGLVLHFVSPSLVFGPDPIVGLDFDTHYQQTLRAVEAYRKSGRVWSYDPHLLAGQPSGAIFDADNKLFEVFAIFLDAMGVATHRAFNLLILLLHLLVPAVGYAAARLFELKRPAAVGAAWLASMLWFFDALGHWCFYVGMIAWGSSAYAILLPLGLMYRWSQTRRFRLLAALFAVMVVVHHLHPYSFFVLVAPMTLLYLRQRKELRWQHHAALWSVALGVLVFNSWWLIPAIQLWHYILDSGFYMDATPAYLVYDYFGLLKEPDIHGVIGMRTGFRFLTFGAAALGLWSWRRSKDDRYTPLAMALGIVLFIAYVGRWVAPLRQLQPYRFVLPAMYLAVLPGASWLYAAGQKMKDERPTMPTLGVLGLLAFVALPRLGRDVLYFLPAWVPTHDRPLPAPPPDINGGSGFGTIWWPRPFEFRNRPLRPVDRFGINAVKQLDDGSGRWLVQWWNQGERVAWGTKAQILGGFREINLAHSDANLFRLFPESAPPPAGVLERYLKQYNVKWIMLGGIIPWLESRRDLFELVLNKQGQRVYRTRAASSWFMDGGPGRVEASVDHLRITGSVGKERVLKYHFLETLICRPQCELYRAKLPGNRVGFIGIRGAPRDFEIINP